ncbi:MAG TPA: 16S rRNA (cytosine(1402)-N(4))-methyltransferase RsmH, partial [Thermomicrobiales bacterium]|nr:16S rRNA (cytosine(1402)-N(4))-methyltransferase RsmH [Thermomicrobiales bacterium]
MYEQEPDIVQPSGAGAHEHFTSPEAVTASHISVLADEAVAALAVRPGGVYVDGTFGAGGHARRIAERVGPAGHVVCIDRDPAVERHFAALAADFPDIVEFANDSYANMAAVVRRLGFDAVDGILLDLGLSSMQLGEAKRGFSFQAEGPLDMRFDPTRGVSAADLIARTGEVELARILFEYGEEPQSRRIARAIVAERERRPIRTTTDLGALVQRTIGRRPGARIHPATRTFQALRIAVNDELGEVERGVQAGIDLLRPGGRMAVISFHSLEDRIVKRAFAEAARGCICPRDVPICVCGRVPVVRHVGKAIRPGEAEVARNPRARSATLRVVERL